jgi:hypothetical protein
MTRNGHWTLRVLIGGLQPLNEEIRGACGGRVVELEVMPEIRDRRLEGRNVKCVISAGIDDELAADHHRHGKRHSQKSSHFRSPFKGAMSDYRTSITLMYKTFLERAEGGPPGLTVC